MKSTLLRTIKVAALSLALSLATSGVIFANGAGAPTTSTSLNGAGNGAGGGTTWSKKKAAKKRVAKRIKRRSNRQTAKA